MGNDDSIQQLRHLVIVAVVIIVVVFCHHHVFAQAGCSFFLAVSASDVLIDVLKYLTIKIKYLYNIKVYLILNTSL